VNSRSLAEFDGLIIDRNRGPRSMRDLNPDISPAVDAIVRKLLAPKPENRYQSAADLHEDLERQLSHRPLQFAADRSIAERLGKWRRRHPRTLVAMLLTAVLSMAGGTGAFAYHQNEKRIVGEAEAQARDARSGLESVRLDLVIPTDPEARAQGVEKALVILGEYGLPNDPNWKNRPAFQRLPEGQKTALAGDLGELLGLVAQVRWDDGKAADREAAARDALFLNSLAADCFGGSPPPFLARQKAEIEGSEKPSAVPATPRDKFLDATALIAVGQYRSAIDLLEKVVVASPDHGAAQFCLAYSRHQLGQYEFAVERYKMAHSLLPNDPRPPLYLGIAYGLSKKTGGAAEAEKAFTLAIDLDPKRGEFYRNRGIARMEQGHLDEAEQDLTEALRNGASKLQVYALRMRVREFREDHEGAEADRKAFAELRPETDKDYIAIAATHVNSDPKTALTEFRSAEEKNPRSLSALLNQAHVLVDFLKDDAGALKVLDRVAELYPEYGPARASRAILLARLGKNEDAHREADAAGKLSNDFTVIYRRACVYAITSKTQEQDRKQAILLLKKAFREGYHRVDAYESDPNLDGLRDLPEFKEVVKAVKGLQ
jgi:tetratricopeptide (TPR) repeat protein